MTLSPTAAAHQQPPRKVDLKVRQVGPKEDRKDRQVDRKVVPKVPQVGRKVPLRERPNSPPPQRPKASHGHSIVTLGARNLWPGVQATSQASEAVAPQAPTLLVRFRPRAFRSTHPITREATGPEPACIRENAAQSHQHTHVASSKTWTTQRAALCRAAPREGLNK